MRHIDITERRARLGRRHFLAAVAASPEQVATHMVGLHSSDPVTVFLSVRARMADFTRNQMETVLYERRTLVRMLGMRRTLFVVDPELAGVMNSACTRGLVATEQRRLAKLVQEQQLAPDGTRWVDETCAATLAAIEERGEALATELRQDVPELTRKLRFGEGKSWGGEVGVSTRILFLLATEAKIVRARPRGSWLSSQYRWAPTASWLGGELPEPDTPTAQAELLARWLQTFGPGTLTDIKWWTGWTLRDTRAALRHCSAVEVSIDDTDGETSAFVLPDDLEPVTAPPPWAALLPGLDPTPMGWKQRNWFLGDHAESLFDRNGNIGPSVWCDGRIVGGWAQRPSGEVAVELLEAVAPDCRRTVKREGESLEAWLDSDNITPRFRTPLDKRLSAVG